MRWRGEDRRGVGVIHLGQPLDLLKELKLLGYCNSLGGAAVPPAEHCRHDYRPSHLTHR